MKMSEIAREQEKQYDGSEGIDLERVMKSDAVGVNGKLRTDNIKVFMSLYKRRIIDARNYMFKYSRYPFVKADHKRAMDNLNRAYEYLRDVMREQMLIDAPTMEDRYKPEWNDLYWSLPHNLYQLGDRVMNMIKESPYSSFHQDLDRLRSTRLRWKEAK